jgi:23S rRNA-/tRNA-specific pseudouridylate synthase
VHLYHLGHPIIGDPFYGDTSRQAQYPRLMLHARRIRLKLPVGDSATAEAPIPPSFQTVLDAAAKD